MPRSARLAGAATTSATTYGLQSMPHEFQTQIFFGAPGNAQGYSRQQPLLTGHVSIRRGTAADVELLGKTRDGTSKAREEGFTVHSPRIGSCWPQVSPRRIVLRPCGRVMLADAMSVPFVGAAVNWCLQHSRAGVAGERA